MTDIASLQITADTNDVVAAVRRLLELERATRAAERALRNQRREVDLGGRAIERMARNMQFLQRALLSVGSGLLGLSALRNVVSTMAAYEKALVGVAKTTGSTAAETKVLDDRFKRLGLTMAVPVNELLGYARIAGQLGVRGTENITKFARAMGFLATSTQDIRGEEGALQLSKLINLIGASPGEVEKLSSAIVQLGNNMGATEGNILRTATFVGASLAPFKVGTKDILGFSAAIAALGQRAETSATAFYKVFGLMGDAVNKGGADLQRFASVSKMSMDEFAATFNESSSAAFVAFLKGIASSKLSGAEFRSLLESIGLDASESARPLAALASNIALLEKGSIEAGIGLTGLNAAEAEATRAADTLWGSIERLKNAYSLLIVNLGESGLGNVIRSTVDLFREVLIIFGGLTGYVDSVSGSSRFAATAISTLAAAMAGLYLGRFIVLLLSTARAFGLLTRASAAFNVTMRVNPIGAALAIIGALVGALYSAEAAYEETTEAAKRFKEQQRENEDRGSRIREIELELKFADKTGNVEKRIEAMSKQLRELEGLGADVGKSLQANITNMSLEELLSSASLPSVKLWEQQIEQAAKLGVELDKLRAQGPLLPPAARPTEGLDVSRFVGAPPQVGEIVDSSASRSDLQLAIGKKVEELRKQLAELSTGGSKLDLAKPFTEGEEAADKFLAKLREQTEVARASVEGDLAGKLVEARQRAVGALDGNKVPDQEEYLRLVDEEIRQQYELAEAIKAREDLRKQLEDEKDAYYDAIESVNEYAASLEDEIKLLGMSKEAREVEAKVMELQAIARKGDVELTKDQINYVRLLAETIQSMSVKKGRNDAEDTIDNLNRELALLGESRTMRDAVNTSVRIKNQMEQDGIAMTEEQLASLQEQLAQYYEIVETVEKFRAVGQDTGTAIGESLKQAVQEGGKLRDLLTSVYDRLWQSAFDQFVTGYLQEMMGQLFASIGLAVTSSNVKLAAAGNTAGSAIVAGCTAGGAALITAATTAAAIMATGSATGGAAGAGAAAGGSAGTAAAGSGASQGAMAHGFHFGGVWGAGGLITAYARGGIDRGLSASLAGGVVSSPTMVPQALLGEGTRPEAIMPLEKTTNGQLAVMATINGRSTSLPIARLGDGNMGVKFDVEAPQTFGSGGVVGGNAGFGGGVTRVDAPAYTPSGGQQGARQVNVYQTITTPDPDAFRASQKQMATRTRRSMR